LNDRQKTIRRAEAMLKVGSMMTESAFGDISGFVVVVRGGPGAATSTTCAAVATILGLGYDAVDGLRPLEPVKVPMMLQACFSRYATEHDHRNVAESLVRHAPGSLLIVPVVGSDEDLEIARESIAKVSNLVVSCAYD
jgi:hypothetical protein